MSMNQQPRNPSQGDQQQPSPGNQGGGNQAPQREPQRQDDGSNTQRQPNQPKPQGERQK
ncbi:MAG TPA: hypothetical protein VEX14_17255 [Burkholderiaceae bacterium]|nr:hypothetical protein [Burkholderiaceae bacterium]